MLLTSLSCNWRETRRMLLFFKIIYRFDMTAFTSWLRVRVSFLTLTTQQPVDFSKTIELCRVEVRLSNINSEREKQTANHLRISALKADGLLEK